MYSRDEGQSWTAWPGQVQWGMMDAGSFQRILLRGTVSSFHDGVLFNGAAVQSDSADPDEGNNQVTVETEILPKKGDLNGDDVIELKDAIMALRICVRLDTATSYLDADATGDGRIGMDDGIYILKIIVEQAK